MKAKTLITLVTFILIATLACTANADDKITPANQIVLIVDASGSMQNFPDVIRRAVSLIEAIQQRKFKRWESNRDIVTVISLDAAPESIWRGYAEDLKAVSAEFWSGQFTARRKNFGACTDIGVALQQAVKLFADRPGFSFSRYIFAWTDGVSEPTLSARGGRFRCARKSDEPPENVPWAALKNVGVSVYDVNPTVKWAWRKALTQHGLEQSFSLFTPEESESMPVEAPGAASLSPDEILRQHHKARTEVKGFFHALATIGAWIVGGIILLIAGVLLNVRFRSHRGRRREGPSPSGARRVNGPVPPLNIGLSNRPNGSASTSGMGRT